MKLFTRSLAALALLAASLAPSLAADITIRIGNNWYRGPGVTTGDSDIRTINVGDRINFQWMAGFHPTQSTSATPAWATFTLGASNPTFLTNPFNTPGTYPYHCQAHGAPGQFQYGVLTVVANPSATLDARLAGITVSVYPNPSRGQVTVQLNQKAGADYKLRLNNIIGQEIRTVALKPELTAAGLPLDLSDLPVGVYFYTLLVDGKAISTRRLVLQN